MCNLMKSIPATMLSDFVVTNSYLAEMRVI